MKKRIVWLVVSCLMVISLVMASCGPAEEEEVEIGEAEVVIEGEEEEVEEEVVEEEGLLPPEVPKYGGTLTVGWMGNSGWDPFNMMFIFTGHIYINSQPLMSGDWAKCPAGTGENDALASFGGRIELMTGWLAESWELPDAETIIFNIRKGVYWQDKPPVNGREFVADDAVWTINRAFEMPRTWHHMFTVAGNNPTSVKALDKYTVEIKVKPEVRAMLLLEIGNQLRICPPDITEVYGDMEDWRNACGTGPWILVDAVPDVSNTYERNPNYWQYDPIHPENRLPYPDKLVTMFIADASTRQAAFRTGKLDAQYNTTWEDWELFMKQCPDLKYVQTLPDFSPILGMRVDKPELPYHDIRVRRAMNMAVNKQEIIDEYYGGHADMLNYPVKDMKVFEPYFIPLEEMPESVQELFTYNPEKARQLLTEAGYPDGFKTVVQTTAAGADFQSILKEYYRKVGIDMEIETVEGGAMGGISVGRTHKELLMGVGKTSLPFFFWTTRLEDMHNKSLWESERVRAAYNEMNQVLGVDDAAVARIMRDISPHILENAPYVFLPISHAFTMWWPWLQNFRGEQDIGYCAQASQWTFIWIDEALKKHMGY